MNFISMQDERQPASRVEELVVTLKDLIRQARQQAVREVDRIQVRTCWIIGQRIVEFEQGGERRATYGKKLLRDISARLTAEFGKGFDASNLRYMRLFYQTFRNCDALRHELSWTHYRLLLRIEDESARQWYMHEAARPELDHSRPGAPNGHSLLRTSSGQPGPGGRQGGGAGKAHECDHVSSGVCP